MKSLLAFPLVVCGTIACAGVGERTDSTKIIPVEDITARDTSPPPAPPPLSRLSLLDSLPSGGRCGVKRYRANADQAREVTYETSSPRRTYVIEIGKPPRRFPAVSIDIRGTQSGTDRTETENVFVGFTESGSVSVGTKRYTATGAITANDRAPLDVTENATVLAFVRKILDRCDTGR
ncbi:MAG: hypothetical protein AABZ80_06490 [Gemmatimonadota bacterium]